MKAGIIDIFAESFGWVLGKAAFFAMAVFLGIGIGASGLWVGTAISSGEFGFKSGEHPIHQYLSVVTAILPQVLVIFWAGMIFVRSENAAARHWVTIVGLEALTLTACFSRAIPGGWFSVVTAWMVTFAGIVAVYYAIISLERRQVKRGLDHLERLQMANAIRREEMKRKYGTESTSAHDLGIL